MQLLDISLTLDERMAQRGLEKYQYSNYTLRSSPEGL